MAFYVRSAYGGESPRLYQGGPDRYAPVPPLANRLFRYVRRTQSPQTAFVTWSAQGTYENYTFKEFPTNEEIEAFDGDVFVGGHRYRVPGWQAVQLQNIGSRYWGNVGHEGDYFATEVEGWASGANYDQRILATNGLVAYWKLDDTGSTAVDSKGSLNGSIIGGVTQQQTPIVTNSGYSMRFDGATGQVSIPYSAALAHPNAFTIEAWIRPLATSGISTIFRVRDFGVVLYWYATGANRGLAYAVVYDSAGRYCLTQTQGTVNDPTAALQHVTVRWNGSKLAVSQDGVVWPFGYVTPGFTTPYFGSLGARIGNDGGGAFNGYIDNVAFYSRALTDDEIEDHSLTTRNSL